MHSKLNILVTVTVLAILMIRIRCHVHPPELEGQKVASRSCWDSEGRLDWVSQTVDFGSYQHMDFIWNLDTDQPEEGLRKSRTGPPRRLSQCSIVTARHKSWSLNSKRTFKLNILVTVTVLAIPMIRIRCHVHCHPPEHFEVSNFNSTVRTSPRSRRHRSFAASYF